ncbi:TetR/AcrR family transcriptional regulator C-terminal domain-containing protein [Microtetraspora sp. AC03309]|uniref:TetR/AcrR family transcriptional regulator n=1 Tax=Microtetraspora sp. AC03309 TaxID=2779376 RepID=UPI001E522BD7|nr:TetR/AcrR family transcriptional regulator C-terminal domain-containing protein [Microtetraspora sp. AC03309]MCC5578712.1 TetR/AcrR family transcriptional regulator C-terminal domain-containing protein [Microtetraspora sp. AC03309]
MPGKPFTSVWTRERKGRREQGLSRDQIVRAALDLLDEEGLDALSMRKLGARIGAGATSLYWHVANKDELLELALDEIYGEVATPADASWRETAGAVAWGLRGVVLAHPWSVGLIGVLPSIGPNALTMSDRLLKAGRRAGFQGIDIDFAVNAVIAYTLGAAIPEAAWRGLVSRSGASPNEAQTAMAPAIEQLAEPYPDLLERYKDYMSQGFDPATTKQIGFDYGLLALLDGLDARPGRRGVEEGGASPMPRPGGKDVEEGDTSLMPRTRP